MRSVFLSSSRTLTHMCLLQDVRGRNNGVWYRDRHTKDFNAISRLLSWECVPSAGAPKRKDTCLLCLEELWKILKRGERCSWGFSSWFLRTRSTFQTEGTSIIWTEKTGNIAEDGAGMSGGTTRVKLDRDTVIMSQQDSCDQLRTLDRHKRDPRGKQITHRVRGRQH
jgi:hypothetical protein